MYIKKRVIFFRYFVERIMAYDNNSSQIQPSSVTNLIQPTFIPASEPYHKSICGSILHSTPTNSPSEIFSYLRHGTFDAFRRSIDVYHKEIIQMKNDHGQVRIFYFIISYIFLFIIDRLYYMY